MNKEKDSTSRLASPVALHEFQTYYTRVLAVLKSDAERLGVEPIRNDLDFLIKRAEPSFRLHRALRNGAVNG
jgi:hypothetical protein